jgi:hypothetical protein
LIRFISRIAKSACAIEETPANAMPTGTTWINSAPGNELFAGRLQHWVDDQRRRRAVLLKTE